MIDVDKHLLVDDDGTPVAVQISYEDWLRLEGYLAAVADAPETAEDAAASGAAPSDPAPPPASRPAPSGWPSRTGAEEEEDFRKRMLEQWEDLDDADGAGSAESTDSADPFDQVLDDARGTWSDASSLPDASRPRRAVRSSGDGA
jgi:hypothetical protein